MRRVGMLHYARKFSGEECRSRTPREAMKTEHILGTVRIVAQSSSVAREMISIEQQLQLLMQVTAAAATKYHFEEAVY